MSDDEQETLKCTYCDSVLEDDVKPIVLPCGHEACDRCLPVIRADGRACSVDSCRGVGLCEPGESEAQALARKRRELADCEDQLLALQLRRSLELDKAATATHDKIASVRHDYKSDLEDRLRVRLWNIPGPQTDESTLTIVHRLFCPDARFGREDYICKKLAVKPRWDRMRGAYEVGENVIAGYREAVRYSYAQQYKVPIELLYQVLDDPDSGIAIDETYTYKTTHDHVGRVCLETCAIEIRERDAHDWTIPVQSVIVTGNGDVLYNDGPLSAAEIGEGWFGESVRGDPTRRDKRCRLLAAALVRKERAILTRYAVEDEKIARLSKTLECDVEALEMRLEFPSPAEVAPASSGARTTAAALVFEYTTKVRNTFKAVEECYSSCGDGRYWPGAQRLRINTVVVPVSARHAVVVGFGRLTLVDIEGDALRDEVRAGRHAFVLCYPATIKWVIARGNTVWVKYRDLHDAKYVEGYDMSTFALVDEPAPKVVFSEVPPKLENGLREMHVVADFASIRTLIWFRVTPNCCPRALGSILY